MDGPTTKAGEYRQHAEQASRQALEAREVEAKRTFEELAQYWRLIADMAERQSW